MKYQNLEETYDKLFQEKVLPYIEENIERNNRTRPAYHLLDELDINRFRGALPILIAREYGIEADKMLPVSAFCEFSFTTAMAQDDFYDHDDCREGVKAAHTKFGERKTLISCDYVNHRLVDLLNSQLSSEEFSKKQRTSIQRKANKGMSSWYESNLMEIESRKELEEINEEYLNKIYLSKTIHGRLLLDMVFSLVQDSEETLEQINKYGEHLAIAGQLKNDIYDFVKHEKYRGLSDLRKGHITWPLYMLLQSLEDQRKNTILNNLENNDHDKIIELMRDKNIDSKIVKKIDKHVEEAKSIIKSNQLPKTVEEILLIWAEGNRDFSKKPKI